MLRMETIQYNLPQDRIPHAWYNIQADLPRPLAPPLHPGTLKPIGPDDLAPLFPMALIMQEVSQEREIEIPDPVRQVYAQWRPSPLFRARRHQAAVDGDGRGAVGIFAGDGLRLLWAGVQGVYGAGEL